jgi:ATP-dependent Lhr-like helicase
MSVNADLIYDVLRKHEPDHILLRATRAEAARGLTDVGRIGALLARAKGRITHRRLDQVSPLAVPVMIEEGREWVAGGAQDALLAEAAALVDEATGGLDAFMETLANVTAEFPVRGDRDRPKRHNRFVRSAPKSLRR